MVCKIFFFSVFPDIPDNAGKVTRRRRKRRTQAIAKRYAFHSNAKKNLRSAENIIHWVNKIMDGTCRIFRIIIIL